jgi:hypothetical protein
MSFLDKLKSAAGVAAQTATSAADTAVKQTKTLASIGRVKLAIAGEEDKLKKAYTELGRLFYRDYEAQAEADMEEYLPWVGKASDARAQIQQLTEELEKIKAEAASETAPGAEPQPEDPAIFVDFAEAEESTETAEEPVLEAEEPEVATEEAAPDPEEPVEAEAAPTEEEAPAPTVGTLYVDISGQE